MRVLCFVLLMASVASAEAIVLRGSYVRPRPGGGDMIRTGLDGYALLAADGKTVTGGRLNFNGYDSYFMDVKDGVWTADEILGPTISTGDLYLTGYGCRGLEGWACRNPRQYEMEFTNWAFEFQHNELSDGSGVTGTYYTVDIGDANLDGQFDSGDLVQVFTAGQYEDNTICWVNELGTRVCQLNEHSWLGNSTWDTGDWNGDLDFDSGDLVAAFQAGSYQSGARAFVPEPSAILLVVVGVLVVLARR